MGVDMKILKTILLATILLASGCASMQQLSSEVHKAGKAGNLGVTKIYPIDTNQSWEIARAVFRWEQTDEIDEHPEENYMITSTGMKMLAFGSVMGVWIEPVDSSASKITVITKRRVESDKFTRLDADTFYRRFEQGMKILKEGKKLPVAAPVNHEIW